ncbi:hypothetical protein F5888DRAFT_1161714 [Russula emetica]|nr:hypothetical protein F5888DRAFT_1161714 [Russula emetica]
MSDDPIGTCCAIAIVACLDVCSGICFDFASFRHGCTENMCRCRCCERSEKRRPNPWCPILANSQRLLYRRSHLPSFRLPPPSPTTPLTTVIISFSWNTYAMSFRDTSYLSNSP